MIGRMVDVSEKAVTPRTAIAEALVWLGPELAELLKDSGKTKKGPVLETAIIAGIEAVKTSDLIPMCHPFHFLQQGSKFNSKENKHEFGFRFKN